MATAPMKLTPMIATAARPISISTRRSTLPADDGLEVHPPHHTSRWYQEPHPLTVGPGRQ